MASGSAEGQQSVDCLRLEDIDIRHRDHHGTGHATQQSIYSQQLTEGIIRRAFADPRQVTDLVRNGADPDSEPRLRRRGSGANGRAYRLLCLAIDNWSDNTMPIQAADSTGRLSPVVLPMWSSPELEAAILNALIDGGADMNEPTFWDSQPIRMAIRGGNESAMRVLLARGAAVRPPRGLPFRLVMELPRPIPDRVGHQVPMAYEQRLLSVYRRLIQHDATLATEQDAGGYNLIHKAASDELGRYSQAFIDSYLDLLVDNGANVTAVDAADWTPLELAADAGSPCVIDYLGRHAPSSDINRGTPGDPNETPLYFAADRLDASIALSQDPVDIGQHLRDRATSKIPLYEASVRSLLRSGADVGQMPTDTELDRRRRDLVLPQCTAVLNTDVHTGAMAASTPPLPLSGR
ncbi:unnamed protein product [Vitrella brassicaformis CCMP3155]|uniref:Uncharacterized protein n=1 Tax=Vitrella brassicaformis (strain CCMP3155) TaxID=1169540 RepID=A0A0G4G5Y0_VITBC|nr:unnamed protein product [Vitrella brassicaformis CCMP3155]|eukprot:CEM23807.1 unnamed protein product [Vitrella brassicaformis CCMP3155]